MNWFSYKAVDQHGGHVAGTIQAIDRKSAVVALTDKGHFVTELTKEIRSQSAGVVDDKKGARAGPAK